MTISDKRLHCSHCETNINNINLNATRFFTKSCPLNSTNLLLSFYSSLPSSCSLPSPFCLFTSSITYPHHIVTYFPRKAEHSVKKLNTIVIQTKISFYEKIFTHFYFAVCIYCQLPIADCQLFLPKHTHRKSI